MEYSRLRYQGDMFHVRAHLTQWRYRSCKRVRPEHAKVFENVFAKKLNLLRYSVWAERDFYNDPLCLKLLEDGRKIMDLHIHGGKYLILGQGHGMISAIKNNLVPNDKDLYKEMDRKRAGYHLSLDEIMCLHDESTTDEDEGGEGGGDGDDNLPPGVPPPPTRKVPVPTPAASSSDCVLPPPAPPPSSRSRTPPGPPPPPRLTAPGGPGEWI